MRYLNQLDYPDVPYVTNVDHPDRPLPDNSVKRAGCGLCALCMVVDRLCLENLSLEECRDLSYSAGANRDPGTSMKVLAPVVAERFDLDLTTTDDPRLLAECLRSGGAGIVHVGGDREGHTGIFSHGGHYVTAISVREREFCILDPSWKPDKYREEPRPGVVRERGRFLYVTAETLLEDTAERSPGFYLFRRRSDDPSQA